MAICSTMVSIENFKRVALSFPGTEAKPHFERTAFAVRGKRIFATLKEDDQTANLKFTPKDQDIYCCFNRQYVYPVPNKFGLQGWTTFELRHLPHELISDALLTAYNDVIDANHKSKTARK